MSGFVFQSVKWLVIERGAQIFIALLLNSVLARHLGVESYGVLQAALSAVVVFSSAALICGSELILPIYGEDQKKHKNIFAEAFLSRLFFQGIAFIACIFFIINTQEKNIFLYLTLALIVLLVEPANVFSIYFQFLGRQKLISNLRLMAVLSKLLVVCAFIYWNVGFDKFGVAYLFEAMVVAFGLMVAYRLKGFSLTKRPTRFLMEQIFSNGILFGAGIFFMIFFQNIDKLALNHFGMRFELGLYSAAAQIAGNWYGVASMIIQSISGRLIYSKPAVEANRMILKMAAIGVLVTVFATFFAYILGPFFMKKFFGDSYEKSADYLTWMVAVSSLVFIDAIFSMKMIKSRKSLIFTIKWFFAAVGAIAYTYGCKYLDFQYYPIIGLIVGYMIAATFSCINFFIEVEREENINNL